MRRFFLSVLIVGLEILVPSLAFGRAPDSPRDVIKSERAKPALRPETDRDPTIPSASMIERLGALLQNTTPIPPERETRSQEIVSISALNPDIRIKAIVLSDDDHGSVILAANGKSVSLKLSRALIADPTNHSFRTKCGFFLGSIYYAVEDFSEHSIRLRQSSDNSVLVVQ